MDTVLVWAGAFTVIAGVVGVLWRLLRGLVRTAGRMDQFMDDWYGEPPRAGVPARPGVLERVGEIEARLARVDHELHPNDGQSLRDAVDRANACLARICLDPPSGG
ncbi:hypothetical protein [Streptomyces sp. H27-H5]|uniref:hypothetical protein n=1 Tax=Streptomyces sp. H27-H5 TaxID=2996460 RepID=UPI00226E3784|nr:hypothetical protein [Streptomyces sp. H27-H5]MCY0957759.1 hypothetical protein [Streptomyces sp. H27-H5]